MDKSVKISMLLEIYKNILTDRQVDIVEWYYNQNLSLSEIADELNITRQAVRKSLIEAEKNLFSLEEKLKLLEKKLQKEKIIGEILALTDDKKIIKLVEELKND